MSHITNQHWVVMGVSGCGKTTMGQFLAREFDRSFADADDYHPSANIEKMVAGEPLTDDDRQPWLQELNQLLRSAQGHRMVLACSALKQQYRERLAQGVEVCFIYLAISPEQVQQRLQQREAHFMPISLIESQFQTLEPPLNAVTLDAGQALNTVQEQALHLLKTNI